MLLLVMMLAVSVSAEKIMIIGDSHTDGYYGSYLKVSLQTEGAQVWKYSVGGSSPITWDLGTCKGIGEGEGECYLLSVITSTQSTAEPFSGEELKPYSFSNLKSQVQPDIVIITLGTNILVGDQHIIPLAQAAASGGTTCYWVGPSKIDPTKKSNIGGVAADIASKVSSYCTFIDSLPLTDENKLSSDGVHYTNEGAEEWAKGVLNQIKMSGFAPGLNELTSQAVATRGEVVAGVASAGTSTYTSTCYSQVCTEIDTVWTSISSTLGGEGVGKIWSGTAWVERLAVPVPPTVGTSYTGPLSQEPKVNSDLAQGKYDSVFLNKVDMVCQELNINPLHLLAVMSFETGGTFSPSKKNPGSSATGLIQFMESTAKNLGTTTSDLAKMTQVQQMDYVKKYFEQFSNIRPNNFGDVAMAVIWPVAIGKDDNYVLFRKGDDAYGPNAKLDTNKNDEIVRGEYLSFVSKQGYTLS